MSRLHHLELLSLKLLKRLAVPLPSLAPLAGEISEMLLRVFSLSVSSESCITKATENTNNSTTQTTFDV